jgi:uncharacterized Zn-binding protein involved in type VI secretion
MQMWSVAVAQQPPQQILSGNPGVSIEGKSAASGGEISSRGDVVTGNSPDVFIGGKPAATTGAETECGGMVFTGSSSVFINGKPMATEGSLVSNCMK